MVAAGGGLRKFFEKRKVKRIEFKKVSEGVQLRYCKVYAVDDAEGKEGRQAGASPSQLLGKEGVERNTRTDCLIVFTTYPQ